MKKILILTTGEGTVGAITSIKNIYNYINKKHFKIFIGVDSYGNNAESLRINNYPVKILNLKFGNALNEFLRKKYSFSKLKQLFVIYCKDKKTINNWIQEHEINIIHTNYYHHHLLTLFSNKKTKVIWHFRSFINPKSLHGISYKLFNILLFFSPAHIIAISNSLKHSFWKINQKKISVIYNGIDLELLRNHDLNEFYHRIGEHKYSHIIGTVGRYNKIKGLHIFVDMAKTVLKEFPNILFVIIGPKDNPKDIEYLNYIQKKIAEYNLEDKILLLGEFQNANKFISALDILVHPNIQLEGFGNVILEAQANGIPVITTYCGGPTEVVRNNISGFIVKDPTPFHLASKLKLLLSDQIKYNEMSKNAMDINFINRFRIENTINKLENIYKSL